MDILYIIAITIGATATLLGLLTPLSQYAGGRPKKNLSPDVPHVELRLAEVEQCIKRQEYVEGAYTWAHNFLVIGQYVVGGALASSFIRQNLSGSVIGFLGVLVLISSIIHQRMRPDSKVIGARNRLVRLKSLLREAEDKLSTLRIENDGSDRELRLAEAPITKMISDGLAAIERREYVELHGLYKAKLEKEDV